MRYFLPGLLAIGFVGCGSSSSEPVSLSIPNPEKQIQTGTSETDASEAGVRGNGAGRNGSTAASEESDPVVKQLIVRANTAIASGNRLRAIEALSQAIGIVPDDSRLLRSRAEVYNIMQEYANARADFSTAVSVDPDNADLYNARGYFLMGRNLLDEAIADFNKALKLNPEFGVAMNNRGLVALARGEFQAAEKDFAAAVKLDENYADGWNNLGFAQFRMQRLDEAVRNFQRATQIQPQYVTAWLNCGMAYMQKKDFQAAVEMYTKACELAPLDVRWLAQRRDANEKLERFAEVAADNRRIQWLSGLSQLSERMTRNPEDPELWVQRGNFLAGGEEYVGAIQDFSRALKLKPGHVAALNSRAAAWLALNKVQNALADCDESLVSQPTDNDQAFSIRGDAWVLAGNFDQAISDFEQARRFDERVARAYRGRAKQLLDEGNAEGAAKDTAHAESIESALAGTAPRDKSASQAPAPFPKDL